ncbi:MAG TPA: sialidase family protein [Vicinamibacterales bacterium]|nr:sialidase family protein [Vicinamibacterales bacterium]
MTIAASPAPEMTTTLAVPQRSNANVSMAADGAFVAVAWSAAASSGATDIFAAVSADGGRAFGAPTRVNDVDGDARVTGEQPPRVSLAHRRDTAPGITIVWTTKGEHGTTLMDAQSTDGGRTFTRVARVPGSDAAGNRGWEAIATDSRGAVDAVWLDHRELAQGAAEMSAMHHEPGGGKPDGVAMAQRSKLFFSALDGSIAPHPITGGVCYCCKTALVSSDGALYAAWRQVYPGNIRDIAFTLSKDGGRTFAPPVRVSQDKWVLEGCPDDGPSMVVDRTHRIHVVWPTLLQEQGQEPNLALFYASSLDGRSFTARERIPTAGTPHHPQMALDGAGRIVVVWDELANGMRHVAVARAGQERSTATPTFTREVIDSAQPGIYPVVAPVSDGVVVAWASGGAASLSVIRVARLTNLR